MASDEERKKAGTRKRRKRLAVTGVLVGLYLVFYVSCYLMVRPKAWIDPTPYDNYWVSHNQFLPSDVICPTNPYGARGGALADGFFLPLTWAEEKCFNRVVWFERERRYSTSIGF